MAKRICFLHFRNHVPHSGNRYLALKLVADAGLEPDLELMRLS